MQIISYDPQRRSLKVRLDDKSVLIEGLADEPAFRRQVRGRTEEHPLWLTRDQAEVLVKMTEYILAKIKISEPSRLALEAILPEVRRLGQPGEPAPAGQSAEPAGEPGGEPAAAGHPRVA